MSVTAAPARRRVRRTTVVSTAVLAVVALILTGFALSYDGLSSSEVEVSDGGVWVSNGDRGLIGRLNVDAGELDARLASTGQDLDIIQSGYHVFETGPRGLTPINTAAVSRAGLVELPPESTVRIGGDRVVIAAPDGRVWILSPEEAAAFSPAAVDPVYETGSGAPPVAVSMSGDVFVLDGEELLRFPRTPKTRDTSADKPFVAGNLSTDAAQVELTVVGDVPVIMDRENRMLRLGTELKNYPLEEYGISSLEVGELQQAGPAADDVVLATADTLLLIPLKGGKAEKIGAGGTGSEVVPPAQVAGCAYGAWGGSLRYVRACEGEEPDVDVIPDAEPGADLSLRQNRDLVVLNDQKFGLSWEIMDSMQLVDDWVIDQDLQTDESKEKEEETLTTTIENVAAERDEENRPPTANDDTFGVRPGQNVVLPVTRNDVDPDGDVLTVDVEGEQPKAGQVSAITGGTQLQIQVADDASGTDTFTYQVDDGRGGKDTATVTLEVRAEGENSGPQPAEETMAKVQVRSGQDVSINILPYWEDPDGDAFYLANAEVEPQDLVSFRPDGLITFNDAGRSPGTKQVQLTFRDQHGETGEGTLEIESVTDNDLAPITTADHVSVVADRTTTLKPLANDLNPNGGDLELISVGESEGLEVDPALDAGTVDVTGAEPGTHYLEYTVGASGSSTTSLGLIRIDVVEPESEDLQPVAVDDLGTVTTGTDTLVDPLENDVDPTGGVLVVNSLEVPEGSGLKATVVDHHLVRVEAEPGATVSEEPVPVAYEVSNSAGTSTGTIRMMVASTDTQFANPEAVPDRAVVRAGDMVNIDVIANDVSPTGADLHLGRIMDTERADDLGHTEPHQDMVRFRADDDASGEAVVQYEVIDETGRTGSALVHITVIPRDAENSPPRPQNLTARAVAGTPVRIPVPTTGIDPDGDSVMLTGAASPMPTLGEITDATGEWIEYLPHEDSVGTDRFRYQVMDRHGAVGTAEVLVGVAAPTERNQAPYAVDDTVEVRPDREVQIPVLENDTDPEGDALGIVREDVQATTDIEVIHPPEDAEDNLVTVTTPSEEGTHTVLYSATDGQLKSSATATIKVAENAPLLAPVAVDDFVSPEQVLDPQREVIDVDVLANDYDPDGSTRDLQVELDGSYEGVELREDGTLRITPQEEQQRLRYIITDQDDLSSAGYVWVPGTAKQAPVWVGEAVEVQAGAEVSIDLADPQKVRVRPGAEAARITDPSLVTATHSDGGELVADESTLRYRPAAEFSGKDTISVEVTDGAVGDDTAATATLAIPVEVAPEDENLPPTFQGAQLDVEQGEGQARVDLAAGAEDPDEGDELTFALAGESSDPEVEVALEDSTFIATATPKATKGTVVDVPVTVSDGTNDPVEATVQVTVTGSTRPKITAALDEATIDAGQTKSIPVLENDSNPFPGGKRTLEDAAVTSGRGEISLDGDEVAITPDEDFHGILTARYSVLDDTGDPDRMATGEIRVVVRGLPEPPSAPRIGEVGDGFVELNFKAGADNGAPITGYTVTAASGGSVSQECESTSCTISGLTNDTEYTFQVVATNEVGDSDPSVPSATARPDVRPEKPGAPRAERGDEQLTVAWSAPVNHGSAIQSYEVQIQDTSGQGTTSQTVEGGSTQTVFAGLTNGRDYRFRVRASNLAEEPSEWSDWSSAEHPAGKPKAPGGTATAERVNTALGGAVEVTWPAMTSAEANGEPITQYIVKASSGETRKVDGDATTVKFQDLDPDKKVSFTYTGVNSVGTGTGASKASNTVTPWAKPEAPTGVKAELPDPSSGDGPNGRVDVSWNAAKGNGTTVTEYVVKGGGKSWTVDGSKRSLRVDQLDPMQSYKFTVEARNGFADDGGISKPSAESNSVKPYTKPGEPTVSASNGTCTAATKCPVTVKASAGGSDGGGGGKTLQVRINGGEWTNSGTSYSKTHQVDSGGKVTIEARVKNGKGLVSGTVSKTQPAQKYTPPAPRVAGDPHWGSTNGASGADGCSSKRCTYFTLDFENLEPGKTYKVEYKNTHPGTKSYGVWADFEITADPSGRAQSPQYHYGYWKETGNPNDVYIKEKGADGEGKKIDSFYSP
jgi:hypothetical protein